jgi:hypothetical protein
MKASAHEASAVGDLSFVVEKVRLLGYAGFWVVVLTGYALTRAFGHVDPDHTLLTEVFGYNNICVYFDHPPATYVLPLLWAVTLVFLLGYMLAHWLQMRAELRAGLLSPRLYRALSGMKLFESFSMVAFSMIFAVSPEGWDHTLYIHTVPFFLLQLGLVSLAMSNTLHGIRSGYWRRLGLPAWFEPAAKVYVVVFALVVCFKIPAATNAMAHELWWKQTEAFKGVAQGVDRLFLLCAAIVPILKAAYFIWALGDRLEVVHLRVRTLDGPAKRARPPA